MKVTLSKVSNVVTSSRQTYISLASGIGALDLGIEIGSSGQAIPVCYVERETSAASVLAVRMEENSLPQAPIWSDIRTFDGRKWNGLVDGVVGGYPCQPFSNAGKKQGFSDPRNLWPAIEQIVRDCEPRWCFFENVDGHLRLGYFDVVKPELERLGYRVEEQVISAHEAGATHQRKRLFILACKYASGGRGYRDDGQAIRELASPSGRGRAYSRIGYKRGAAEAERGILADSFYARWWEQAAPIDDKQNSWWSPSKLRRPSGDVGDSLNDGLEGGWLEHQLNPSKSGEVSVSAEGASDSSSAGHVGTGGDSRDSRIRSSVECQGRFPPPPSSTGAWRRILKSSPYLAPAVKPTLFGVADGYPYGLGIPRSEQLRLLGNAVVPQQAALAWNILWDVHEGKMQ